MRADGRGRVQSGRVCPVKRVCKSVRTERVVGRGGEVTAGGAWAVSHRLLLRAQQVPAAGARAAACKGLWRRRLGASRARTQLCGCITTMRGIRRERGGGDAVAVHRRPPLVDERAQSWRAVPSQARSFGRAGRVVVFVEGRAHRFGRVGHFCVHSRRRRPQTDLAAATGAAPPCAARG